jgi:hypothetical protein
MAAAICRSIILYNKTGVVGGRTSRTDLVINTSNQDILNFATANKDKLEDALRVASGVNKQFRGIGRTSVGVLYWIMADHDKDKALEFFHTYATGTGLKMKHPIKVLRERLIIDMSSKKKYPDKDKCAWAIIAWNNYRKDKDLTSIRWDADKSEFPKPI